MSGWVITATTIYCDAVDDEVTLIIDKDGVAKCTGYNKYFKPNKETAKSLIYKSQRSGRQLRCEGLECHRVSQYTDKLFAREAEPGQEHQP
jgi:hypothetical protein